MPPGRGRITGGTTASSPKICRGLLLPPPTTPPGIEYVDGGGAFHSPAELADSPFVPRLPGIRKIYSVIYGNRDGDLSAFAMVILYRDALTARRAVAVLRRAEDRAVRSLSAGYEWSWRTANGVFRAAITGPRGAVRGADVLTYAHAIQARTRALLD